MLHQVLALLHLHLGLPQRALLALLLEHLLDLGLERGDGLRGAVYGVRGQQAVAHLLRGRPLQHRLQQPAVRLADQGDGAALAASTRRSADTMQVLLQLCRHVVVDHGLNATDIETAARQVGGEQEVDVLVAEAGERLQPLLLRQVAVQLSGRKAQQAKDDLELVRQLLAPHENNHLVAERAHAQGEQQRGAVRVLGRLAPRAARRTNTHKLLHKARRGRALRVHKQAHRALQTQSHELVHVVRHGRGEEHGLPLPRAQTHDLVQLCLEPVLEHAICLIHHQNLDVLHAEARRVAHVVNQTTWCGDHHIRALLQLGLLCLERETTDTQAEAHVHVPCQRRADAVALDRQLTGWAQDHHAGFRLLHPLWAVRQTLEDRDQERSRLAATRDRAGDEVFAGEGQRDGACLDWCRLVEAERVHRTEQLPVQPQRRKRRHRVVRRTAILFLSKVLGLALPRLFRLVLGRNVLVLWLGLLRLLLVTNRVLVLGFLLVTRLVRSLTLHRPSAGAEPLFVALIRALASVAVRPERSLVLILLTTGALVQCTLILVTGILVTGILAAVILVFLAAEVGHL